MAKRIPLELIRHLEWKPGDSIPTLNIDMVQNSACEILTALSARLSVWQSDQAAVGEESMTDWLLFELASRLPAMRYQKFTRHREASETGADWEWWFVFDQGCFGARVQAKRLRVGEDNYPGLAYPNSHGLQIEMLRSDAAKHSLPAFYLHYSPGGLGSAPLCAGPQTAQESGAFVSSAADLYNRFIQPGRKPVSDTQVLARANPIECLACCPSTRVGGLEGLRSYLRSYYPAETGADDGATVGFRAQIPFYVQLLLSRDLQPDTAVADSQAPDITGIAVIDLRGA